MLPNERHNSIPLYEAAKLSPLAPGQSPPSGHVRRLILTPSAPHRPRQSPQVDQESQLGAMRSTGRAGTGSVPKPG